MDDDRGKDDSYKGILLTPYPSYAQTHLAVDTIFKIGEQPYPKFENRIEIEIGGGILTSTSVLGHDNSVNPLEAKLKWGT